MLKLIASYLSSTMRYMHVPSSCASIPLAGTFPKTTPRQKRPIPLRRTSPISPSQPSIRSHVPYPSYSTALLLPCGTRILYSTATICNSCVFRFKIRLRALLKRTKSHRGSAIERLQVWRGECGECLCIVAGDDVIWQELKIEMTEFRGREPTEGVDGW
jgi:hypothetical protein